MQNDLEFERMEAKTGAQLVYLERERQINEEGFAPDRDQEYKEYQLVAAAMCYLTAAPAREQSGIDTSTPPPQWPWAPDWWKPSPHDPIRELVKAGALIVAEIDRRLGAV